MRTRGFFVVDSSTCISMRTGSPAPGRLVPSPEGWYILCRGRRPRLQMQNKIREARRADTQDLLRHSWSFPRVLCQPSGLAECQSVWINLYCISGHVWPLQPRSLTRGRPPQPPRPLLPRPKPRWRRGAKRLDGVDVRCEESSRIFCKIHYRAFASPTTPKNRLGRCTLTPTQSAAFKHRLDRFEIEFSTAFNPELFLQILAMSVDSVGTHKKLMSNRAGA